MDKSYTYPSFVIVACLLLACNSKSGENSQKFIELAENLSKSDLAINRSIQENLASLEEKKSDPPNREKAMVWFPKAAAVQSLCGETYMYLLSLQKKDKVDEHLSTEIYEKLNRLKTNLFAIEKEFSLVFESEISLVGKTFEKGVDGKNEFYHFYFNGASQPEIFTTLSRFKNNIKLAENSLISFCHMKTGSLINDFPVYEGILSQNSSILEPGNTLEITTGIGAMSKAAMPVVFIDNKKIKINESGLAVYTMKVNNQAGKYKMPVKVMFFDQSIGKYDTIVNEIEYTVKKCN